jgi:hypothetical protein
MLSRVELGLDQRVQAILGAEVLETVSGGTLAIWGGQGTRRTGIPELVLMPAPVMTTTLRDFHSAFAMSCSNGSQPGSTCVVGIVMSRPSGAASDGGAGGQQWRAVVEKLAAVY